MSGSYCEKHEEWAPTGECRWCEPPKFDLTAFDDINIFTGELPASERMWRFQVDWSRQAMSGATLQRMMNDLWVKMLRDEKQ